MCVLLAVGLGRVCGFVFGPDMSGTFRLIQIVTLSCQLVYGISHTVEHGVSCGWWFLGLFSDSKLSKASFIT
jgi:hypothetical protein